MLRSTFLLFAAVALGAMGVLASTTDMPVFDASTTNLAKVAAELPRLRLENVNLPNKGTGNLLLERFNVFTPDAVIYNGDQAVLPAVTNAAYFRGKLEDDANSIAVLVAHASGVLRGVVRASDGTHYVLDSDDDDDDDDAPADPNHVHTNSTGMARPRLMDGSEAPSDPLPDQYGCHADSVEHDREAHGNHSHPIDEPFVDDGSDGAHDHAEEDADAAHEEAHEDDAHVSKRGIMPYRYTMRLHVETDVELRKMFRSNEAMISYITDLIGYISTIYEAELDMSIQIVSIQTYDSLDVTADPWCGCDKSGDGKFSATDALRELAAYYRANKARLSRSTVHMLSGKWTGGGIAYMSSLCSNYMGYGVTGGLRGSFRKANPKVPIWDVISVAHELGHNAGSPHSHCYVPPVDRMYTRQPGCASGPAAYPTNCPGAGKRCGSLMSYAGFMRGGFGNIAYSFGGSVKSTTPFPYGDEPMRVINRMSSFIRRTAAANPRCLAPIYPPPSSELQATQPPATTRPATTRPATTHQATLPRTTVAATIPATTRAATTVTVSATTAATTTTVTETAAVAAADEEPTETSTEAPQTVTSTVAGYRDTCAPHLSNGGDTGAGNRADCRDTRLGHAAR